MSSLYLVSSATASAIRVLKHEVESVDEIENQEKLANFGVGESWVDLTYSSSLLIWWVLRFLTTPSACWLRSVMYCQKRLTVACQSGFGGTERAWEPEVETHGSFSPHSSTLKATFIQKWLKKNLPAMSARARIRATAFMVVRLDRFTAVNWTQRNRSKTVEQTLRSRARRHRSAVLSPEGVLRLLLARRSANAVFYSVSGAAVACACLLEGGGSRGGGGDDDDDDVCLQRFLFIAAQLCHQIACKVPADACRACFFFKLSNPFVAAKEEKLF